MDDIRPPKAPKQSLALPQPQALSKLPEVQSELNNSSSQQLPEQTSQSLLSLAPKPRKRHLIVVVISCILLLLSASLGYAFWWYNDALQPLATNQSRHKITVENGATMQHIADELQAKGVIKSSLAFQLYAKQQGKEQAQAGTYLFSPTQPLSEIVAWLNEGKTDSYNVTILPGKMLSDIKEKLIKDGFEAQAIDQAFAKTYDHPLLKTKPEGASLEGYIFPETYQIASDTSVEDLLVKTFDELYSRIEAKALQPLLESHNLTLHQGIILASITQLEVSSDNERRQVAQVLEKRLDIGMPLGSDVTFLYAAKILGKPATVDIDSPYNTRRYTGLPPGPIANFNFSALEAVANPAPGDYLYFVSGDDGITHFSHTLEEHEKKVQQYCTKLCSGD